MELWPSVYGDTYSCLPVFCGLLTFVPRTHSLVSIAVFQYSTAPTSLTMLFKSLSLLALASSALAQSNVTLQQALNSSMDLSTLNGVLGLSPELLTALNGAKNITILAPSNKAFSQVPNATLNALTSNAGLITALLQYHVLNGTYPSSAITNMSAFVPTLLTNPLFTNVTGGQRVQAKLSSGNVTIFSGLLNNSTVTTPVSGSDEILSC